MKKFSLEFDELSFGYGSLILVKNFSGILDSGKINLLIGRAGAGKSTILKTISGFLPFINGKVIFKQGETPLKENVTIAFQNPEQLFFNATVGDEICYALDQQNIDHDEAQNKGKEWLKKWGLCPEKFWNRHPFSLSGGEKRRVALAATTILQTPIILLDEPFAGLDFTGKANLLKVLVELAKDHLLLVVTHDPERFLKFTGKVLLIVKDKIKVFENTQEFLSEALIKEETYPLPDWYKNALKNHFKNDILLPMPEAQEVIQFLRSFCG